MKNVNNENSKEHWEFVNVKDRIVLDLGCGRWNKVEQVDDSWLTTPQYFIEQGAKKVIAVDIDPIEVDWFMNKFKDNNQYEFILNNISSTEHIISLYNAYKPSCVKLDIEGSEQYLLEIDELSFCSVSEYYIETHGQKIYNQFIEIFANYGYNIRELIDLTHTNGLCKVIFAYK
jgi:SAM-dependent methyltransferase